MPDLSERVLQHPAISALDSLDALLEQSTQRAADDPNAVSLVGRLRAMRQHARSTLDGADPALVTDQVLNAVQSNAQNIASYLTSFHNGSGVGALNNALNEADSLFNTLARVPALITGPRAAAVTRALGAYHETVERYTKWVHEQMAATQNRVSQLGTTLAAAEQRVSAMESRIDSAIVQYQATFEAAQAQRQQTFDNAQAQRQQTFDSEMTAHRTEFNELAQQLRTSATTLVDSAKTQLTDAVKALDEAIGQTKSTAKKAAEDVNAEYRGIADTLKTHLEARRDEADKLVGLIGERGVTSTYQKTANAARWEMFGWHFLTVVVLGGLLYGAYAEFVPALAKGWNWGIGGARLMVAVVATLLAGYTGTQAKIAREMMQRNRRREMDLAALGPYLQPLPEVQQHEFRARIADRYFTHDDGTASTNGANGEALLTDPDVVEAAKGLPKTALLAAIKAIAK